MARGACGSAIVCLGIALTVCGCAKDAPSTPDRPAPNFNGRAMGIVRGDDGAGGVPLPGAAVRFVDERRGSPGPAVAADDEGRYELPPHPLGTYRVCAEHPGFVAGCHPDPVEITATSPYAVRMLTLVPEGAAITGEVVLADGSPCARTSTAFGTRLRARVGLAPPGGEETATVESDAHGRFFLAEMPPPGEYELVARCEAARAAMPWTVGAGDGVRRATLTIANAPPESGALSLETMAGVPTRRARAGESVQVVFHATDADDATLAYRFVDGHGGLLPADTGRATLALPDLSAQALVLAEVSDGRGGYGEARLVLSTDPRLYIAGTVLAAGDDPRVTPPLAGARVTLGTTDVVTGADGAFRFDTTSEPPFTLAVAGDGFETRRLVLEEASSELRVLLQPTTRHAVDVRREHTLQDDRGFAEVHLPQYALGRPRLPTMVNVDVTGYDPERPVDFPGSREAEIGGAPANVFLLAAVRVDITDMAGAAVPLVRGVEAELAFPALPAREGVERPAEVALLSYDEARGLWVGEGTATLDGDIYRGEVSHFSVWSVGVVTDENEACVRVDVAPELFNQVVLRAYVEPAYYGGQSLVGEWVPTQPINVVRGLRPFTTLTMAVASRTDPTQTLFTVQEETRNPIVGGPLHFPYIYGLAGCNGWAHIEPELPRQLWLDRIVNTPEEGLEYYAMIGWGPETTLDLWKLAWGFTPEDEAAAISFYNPQEFGLGRRATCHTNGSTPDDIEMACCVAKYGHVGGSVHEALEDTIHDTNVGDTVCMEWRRPPGGGEPFARFLAFRPDGRLSPTTYFDTSGAKALPGVCGHCHGRTQDWRTNGGDMGGRFNYFDVPAYRYASWSAEHTRAAQEERFRILNRYVRMTHRGEGSYADYIDSLYRDGVDTPGAVTSSPDPLPGWVTNPLTWSQVVRPNCRTCHIWQPAPYDFSAPDSSFAEWLHEWLCDGIMPNAMQPTLNLWQRLDPFAGDAITDAFGAEPCFSSDASPTVQILEPAPATRLDLGGLFALHLRADATDAEDGPDCCTVTWASDRDGVLGAGRDVWTTLRSAGVHLLTATARDSRYRVSTASVMVIAENEAPVPEIVFPAADLDPLYRGVPYVLHGRATDANQPLGVPCSALSWTSTVAGDAPFPTTGCHVEVTFTTNGNRTLRLTATDPFGSAATAMRIVSVPDPPLSSPPIPMILFPRMDDAYSGTATMTIRLSVTEPDGTDTATWELRARRSVPAVDVVIASGMCDPGMTCAPTLAWRPLDDLGMACGSYRAELVLTASDVDGTDVATVAFDVIHPPC